MIPRLAAALSLVGMLAATGAVVSAQTTPPAAAAPAQQPPQPPPTNLQVFPKDMTRAAVVTVMRTMAQSLGVQCAYCHVIEGQGGRNDMAADDKKTKQTARVMIKMVLSINDTLTTALGKSADGQLRVQCVTCHRGLAIPKAELPPPPAAAAPAKPPAQ
jgi:hypothetical protein